MMATAERRHPTALQTINKIIPLVILAFTGWIAISTVESKVDRGVINKRLDDIVKVNESVAKDVSVIKKNQEDVKDKLEKHNAATELSQAKISAMHHHEGIKVCHGCHVAIKKNLK